MTPLYVLDGQPCSEADARAHIQQQGYAAGMDPVETDAYIRRAIVAGEDGEEARDTINSFAPDIEIIV